MSPSSCSAVVIEISGVRERQPGDAADGAMKIIDVTSENVDETGFFCLMSRRKSEGWRRKLEWLRARFDEGLRIKMLDLSEGGRGFIEYIPGEYAWRPVEASGYLFIHCLWVVGKSKGNGYAKLLLSQCLADAKASGAQGVAMVTSKGNWLMGKKLLARRGFKVVDAAPPGYELMANDLGAAPPPKFPTDWERRAAKFGHGLTVVRTDQCPYLDDAVNTALEAGRDHGLKVRAVELTSAREIRERAPSPYGVFSIVVDGQVLSHYYQPRNKLDELLDARLERN
jgi:ribosomal protein S18 acetylase RimI-like enzyme